MREAHLAERTSGISPKSGDPMASIVTRRKEILYRRSLWVPQRDSLPSPVLRFGCAPASQPTATAIISSPAGPMVRKCLKSFELNEGWWARENSNL